MEYHSPLLSIYVCMAWKYQISGTVIEAVSIIITIKTKHAKRRMFKGMIPIPSQPRTHRQRSVPSTCLFLRPRVEFDCHRGKTGLGLSSFFSLFFSVFGLACSQSNVHPTRKVLPLFCVLFMFPSTLTDSLLACTGTRTKKKESNQSSLDMAPLPRASSFELLRILCLFVIPPWEWVQFLSFFAWLNSLPFLHLHIYQSLFPFLLLFFYLIFLAS